MDAHHLDRQFLDYAAAKDGLKPGPGEWKESEEYMMVQIKALVGRYSKVGEEAFYRFYIGIDRTLQEALKPHALISLGKRGK